MPSLRLALLVLLILFAALNSLVQLFDLWTTSEVMKSGKGYESNSNMVASATS